MSALSDYAENKVLDVLGANATFTAPSNVYLGLSTGSLGDDDSGTELTGNNYSRRLYFDQNFQFLFQHFLKLVY